MKLKSRIVTWDGNATKIIPINADQSCNVIEIGCEFPYKSRVMAT